MRERSIPVLIVGGGPVGLALAAELGWHGASCELIEQGDGTVTTPKMNEVNTRSMEFCRRWGIANDVLATPFPPDYPTDVVFVTTLAGHELGRVPRLPRKVRASEHSPESMQICSQHWFDPILRRFADSFSTVRLRYGCRLESVEQQTDCVLVSLRNLETGTRERIAAQYVAGCDGAGSAVRSACGIGLTGKGLLGHAVNMFFRAPKLLEVCKRKPGTFFHPVDRGGIWGNMRIIDPVTALWRLMVNETGADANLQGVDKTGYLRRGIGRDFPVEWVDLNIWRRQSVLAESYGSGRVFLAGDAAHQVSPTGALGMNTGLADAVDLGWKLAATLAGWAGDALLASYDAERRLIGRRAVESATGFHMAQVGWGEGLDRLSEDTPVGAAARERIGKMLVDHVGREFRTMGLQLGYRYEGSPICVEDNTPAPCDDPEIYRPSARPGMRAPHCWLAEGRSILDLFGPGFTLLCFGAGAQTRGLERAAASRRMPLRTVTLDDDGARTLYERRLVLIRPDGHVAWRSDAPPEDPGFVLDWVRGALTRD